MQRAKKGNAASYAQNRAFSWVSRILAGAALFFLIKGPARLILFYVGYKALP